MIVTALKDPLALLRLRCDATSTCHPIDILSASSTTVINLIEDV